MYSSPLESHGQSTTWYDGFRFTLPLRLTLPPSARRSIAMIALRSFCAVRRWMLRPSSSIPSAARRAYVWGVPVVGGACVMQYADMSMWPAYPWYSPSFLPSPGLTLALALVNRPTDLPRADLTFPSCHAPGCFPAAHALPSASTRSVACYRARLRPRVVCGVRVRDAGLLLVVL